MIKLNMTKKRYTFEQVRSFEKSFVDTWSDINDELHAMNVELILIEM